MAHARVYAAHFAITDVARGTFQFSDQYSRGALGLAGAQAQPLHVWLNDWELGSTIHARGQGYELTLDTGALGEPVLNGDRGLSRKSAEPGAASYYYSIPRICRSRQTGARRCLVERARTRLARS